MKRLFIDSSVLYSAAYSAKGYARDLLLMGIRGEVLLVISSLVLEETRRNILANAPQAVDFLDLVVNLLPLELVEPLGEDVLIAERFVAKKDAFIVASAKKGHVDYLVTLDKKHLLGNDAAAEYAGVKIITPKVAYRLTTQERETD